MLKLKERFQSMFGEVGADIFICTGCGKEVVLTDLIYEHEDLTYHLKQQHILCDSVVSSITLILDGHEIDIVTGDVVQWRAHGK